jgi:hypothetical protein
MTDSERELYQRTICDCHAVADSMDPDHCLRHPCRVLADALQSLLDEPVQARRSTRPRSPRGHLHAVPTQG